VKNNLKVGIFTLILLILFIECNAQMSGGFSLGTNQNNLDTKFLDKSTLVEKKWGMNFNFLLIYKINSLISAEISSGVIQKNYSIKYISGAYQYFKNTYIQVPVLIQFNKGISSRVNLCVDFGFLGAYWAYGRTKGLIPSVFNIVDSAALLGTTEYIMLEYNEGKYPFDNKKDNRFEFAWLVGTGINYQVNRLDKFFVKSVFQRGLSSQQKKYMLNQTERYNQTVAFLIGFIHDL
jgi:hypothetical protein